MELELIPYLRARRPVLWLVTPEETRAEVTIGALLRKLNETISSNQDKKTKPPTRISYAAWSVVGGKNGGPGWTLPRGESSSTCKTSLYEDAEHGHHAVMGFVNSHLTNPKEKFLSIALIRDAQLLLQEGQFLAALKEANIRLQGTMGTLICLSVTERVPKEIQHCVTIIRPGPPKEETLRTFVSEKLSEVSLAKKHREGNRQLEIINGITNTEEDIVSALKGLTLSEADKLISLSFAASKGKIDVELISSMKARELSTVPGLKLKKKLFSFDDVGSLDNLKNWMRRRRSIFSKEAKDFGISPPKGVVIVGIPGTGKSLIAKATASEFGLPLLSLNISETKGGIVGQSESQIRDALDRADASAPCVLWIDEVEKGVSANSTHNLDGGSSAGQLGIILEWLQERQGDIFVIATANDVSAIPPELVRKGRFNEIFFVDMPSSAGQVAEILSIHIRRKGREFPQDKVLKLAKELITPEGALTGSEIETAVDEGLITAFSEGRELEIYDIRSAALNSVPMYKTMKEKISKLREWCKERAVPASTVREEEPVNETEEDNLTLKLAEVN